MRHRWVFLSFVSLFATVPAIAQDSKATQVVMPAGNYVIESRDSAAKDVAIVGWPFVLKGNGAFTLTTPDSLTFTGKLVQKDGIATYTDQACGDPGVYVVKMERGGYVFDVKSEACAGRDSQWVKLLFRAKKK